jgi:hypothetical protein
MALLASGCVAQAASTALRTIADALTPSACACRAIAARNSGGQRNEMTGVWSFMVLMYTLQAEVYTMLSGVAQRNK